MQYPKERSPINSKIMIVLKRADGIEINPAAKFIMVTPKGKAIPNPTTTTQFTNHRLDPFLKAVSPDKTDLIHFSKTPFCQKKAIFFIIVSESDKESKLVSPVERLDKIERLTVFCKKSSLDQ